MDGAALAFCEEFDAVFSNAVLHWIKDADTMIAGVYRSLRAGGRFVAECGGFSCVHKIRTARWCRLWIGVVWMGKLGFRGIFLRLAITLRVWSARDFGWIVLR